MQIKNECNFIVKGDIFNKKSVFIENIGQYDHLTNLHPEMGAVLFGYEGLSTPILFTTNGIVYFHKEKKKRVEMEEEELTGQTAYKIITQQWLKCNTKAKIITEDTQLAYHTYRFINTKANGYKKIIYKEIYKGIDIEFFFNQKKNAGFDYRIIVKPFASISLIRMKFGGDVKDIFLDKNDLNVCSAFDTIIQQKPFCLIEDKKNDLIACKYNIKKNKVDFLFPSNVDLAKSFIIDPFVTNTSSLTGMNVEIAKDIDFDYAGNIYITGGGDATVHEIAKYNQNGLLQWVFNGSIATPSWDFGYNYGSWCIDKLAGKVYVSQGIDAIRQARTIRLSGTGLYDGFITDTSWRFQENWKMFWINNAGSSQIFCGGGGATSNVNLSIIQPASSTPVLKNITGIPFQINPGQPPLITGGNQDIADIVIDTSSLELYTIFDAKVFNRIYKHKSPYAPTDKLWDFYTGLPTLYEIKNRPYLSSLNDANDNSANVLALNAQYLFYWDGANLAAYNKVTGMPAAPALNYNNQDPLYWGGIYADDCNNVFIGKDSGRIKVLHFTPGAGFDDSPPDILLPGNGTDSTYDLAYDPARKLLYACGSGYVAAFDIANYRNSSNPFTASTINNCSAASVQTIISPANGFPTLYKLFNAGILLDSNSTGTFTGLASGINYSITASINRSCDTPQCSTSFRIGTPIHTNTNFTNATCGNNNGSITVSAVNGLLPYLYSIDSGAIYTSSNTFGMLAAGPYKILVKDANNCSTETLPITIMQLTAPVISAVVTHATCGNSNGSIAISTTNGTATPYRYSRNGGSSYQNSSSFTNLAAGTYQVQVIDTNNCISNDTLATVYNGCLSATDSTNNETCAGNNGSIFIKVATGVPPYQYSKNGGASYQGSNSFTGLAAGSFLIIVKDATGATASLPDTVTLINNITLSAGNAQTICEGSSVSFAASSNAANVLWQGANGTTITNPASLTATALPMATTTCYITANTGICIKKDSVTIVVNPAPIATISRDTTVCAGKNIQLNAGGGVSYHWQPVQYLDNPTIANPVVTQPPAGIYRYSVIATAANNCPSINPASVSVTVTAPAKLFAGNDTSIAINQPLQLNAVDVNNSGFINYTWLPPDGLSNAGIKNPVATLDINTTYRVTATNAANCKGMDTIGIKVYRGPELYVPSAFSPDGYDKNKILFATPVGIRKFNYFRIYNRYGQVVFYTTNANAGWEGKINGTPQNSGAYIWMAEAIDYNGKVLQRKGTVVLVR